MSEATVIGIDLAKRSFQVHGTRSDGSVGSRKILTVRAMLKDGQSIRAIARYFNVGVATIDRIKRATQFS